MTIASNALAGSLADTGSGVAARASRRAGALEPVPGVRWWWRLCRLPCRWFFVLYLRGRVFERRHVPGSGGGLLIANHQSFLDPVLAALALHREAHFMARHTLFQGGRFDRLIRSLNAFPVKRGTADMAAIKESLRILRAGGLLVAFPEATRTRDGSIAPMQPGVVLLARKTGVPLIPTLILGAFDAWPRHSPLPLPGCVYVAYGEPLTPADLAGLSDEEAMTIVRQRILDLLATYAPLRSRALGAR
ncbi:MAG: lysophospholipid acyltransferase family protein [Phycisphaerae bacterium]